LSFLASLAILEIGSYFIFHNILPGHIRVYALYSVGDAQSHPKEAPNIQPYLWGNYRLNPLSLAVNKHGWRYGGSPSRRSGFRILCLGGSTTYSDAASSPEMSYPAQLERHLSNLGYDVDVVNGGAPYYSSAEVFANFAFRGIFTQPNLIVLHTGGNDQEPLMSPQPYQPDYTHWRSVDLDLDGQVNEIDKFRIHWKFPSWTTRLILTVRMKPNPFYKRKTGVQLTTPDESAFATNDIYKREPIGLENNLRNIIAIATERNIKLVTLTFKSKLDNLHRLFPAIKDNSVLRSNVMKRQTFAVEKTNQTIINLSKELGIPVIPYHEFEPSKPDSWADTVHLFDDGLYDKAKYIGDWLITLNLIPIDVKHGD
jgi:hypothetical protein